MWFLLAGLIFNTNTFIAIKADFPRVLQSLANRFNSPIRGVASSFRQQQMRSEAKREDAPDDAFRTPPRRQSKPTPSVGKVVDLTDASDDDVDDEQSSSDSADEGAASSSDTGDDDDDDSELERQQALLAELTRKREAEQRKKRMQQQTAEYAAMQAKAKQEKLDAKQARKLARRQRRAQRREQRLHALQSSIDSERRAAEQRAAEDARGGQRPSHSFSHPIPQNRSGVGAGAGDGESVASCGKAGCDHPPCHASRQSRPQAAVLAAEFNAAINGTGELSTT